MQFASEQKSTGCYNTLQIRIPVPAIIERLTKEEEHAVSGDRISFRSHYTKSGKWI